MKDLTVNIVLTTKCNANCDFCYERHDNRMMSKETIKQTVKHFYSLNPNSITFWLFGGEPTTVPELTLYTIEEIIKHQNNIRTNIGLFTNGIVFNSDITNALVNIKNINNMYSSVQVSYEGACNFKRDNNNLKIRQQIEDNIIAYTKALPTQVRSTFSNENLIDVDAMFESFKWIMESGTFDYTIMPVIESPWDEQSIQKWDDLFSKIKEYMKLTQSNVFSNFHITDYNNKSGEGCAGGKSFFSIDLNGDVYVCHKVGSYSELYDEEFKLGSVYTGFKEFDKIISWDKCKECEVLNCAQCFVTNYQYMNDFNTLPDTGYCKIRKIIWKHYLDYYNFLKDNDLLLKLDVNQEIIVNSLLTIGTLMDNNLIDYLYKFNEYERLVYNLCNDITHRLCDELGKNELLPLALGDDFESNIDTIISFIEKLLIEKYNELFGTDLKVIDDDYVRKLTNSLNLMEVINASN